MSNSFFGLNIATKGLFVAQKNLDVINHNVSNTNTPGYSRQEAVIKAANPMPTADGSGMLGQGSLVTSVKRIRDEYLDVKFWNENTVSGYWSSKSSILNEVEMIYNEPSDSGFNAVTNEFYQTLQDLSKNPKDLAGRSIVKGKAEIQCGDKIIHLEENQSTYIPKGEFHRLSNPFDEPLEIVEIQSGNYLGEDDIERIEDKYGR